VKAAAWGTAPRAAGPRLWMRDLSGHGAVHPAGQRPPGQTVEELSVLSNGP
jgi:hypothetical protein